MYRTPITENADGTFTCTVTMTEAELPDFLRSVHRNDLPVQAAAALPDLIATDAIEAKPEKPPTQIMAVSGFEAFGPMGSDVRVLANHAPFQRFVESHIALDEGGDSVQHALAFINATQDMQGLIERYRVWHAQRWPGEQALPGEA